MRVRGTVRVPGDKSISHRALILAALAEGRSRVRDILESADVESTAGVLRALGASVPPLSPDMVVDGVGAAGLRDPGVPLDCGNSGTTTRLMAGVVAGAGRTATFVGDASLSRRPMRRIAEPLTAMGARVELPPADGLPMIVHGGQLRAARWNSPVASAQVKSAVLLAAVSAGVTVEYHEPERSRDHTERMLAARGVEVRRADTRVELPGPFHVRALDTQVPADPSSAAFFAALAALATDGAIEIPGVCVNETRTGFLRALQLMGAAVRYATRRDEGGEDVADLTVSPGALRGIVVDAAEVPSMVDELPLLACVAARAEGETVITGAAELRVKESDRIAAVVSNLRLLGVDAEERPDGMRVRGGSGPLSGRVTSHGDHRIAMAFGVLGAASGGSVEVDDRACVAISYPAFWADLASATSR